jgi:pyruvate/2-oxoglutarate dehydrogenase complex dihydrolipoamide acyltransferase (E2) component
MYVYQLDTDKVSIDIRSTHQGRVAQWHAKIGDTVKVGSPLLSVETGAAGTASVTPGGRSSASAAAPPKPVAPVQMPAGAPSSDESTKSASPRAQSGPQAPASTQPTDPRDEHRRQPSIAFRFVRESLFTFLLY